MLHTILIGLDIISALGLVAAILLQEGNSQSMGAIMGGPGTSGFGAKKTGMEALLNRATIAFAIAFSILTLAVNVAS